MDPLRLVRADFADLEEYKAVQPLDVLAAELGIAIDELVKLDANENPWGPHPAVVAAARAADFHIYPDPAQSALRESVAGYCGVTAAQVVCGQGADDLIDLVFRLFSPAFIADNVPTFGMYSFLAGVNGATVIEIERLDGFAVDVAANEVAVTEQGATVVFVTSPNNPTGNSLPREDLERLLALEAIVVVDEAYAEFSASSSAHLLDDYPNLLILRTFSKWAGLAGLRVGYALSCPDVIAKLMAIKQPYNVNVAADAAARAAIQHRAEILEDVRGLVAERERMSSLVGDLGWLRPYPSEANFVLFEVVGRSAAEVASALRQKGVLVRYYQKANLENCIRVSAGRPQDTDRLLEALGEVGRQ